MAITHKHMLYNKIAATTTIIMALLASCKTQNVVDNGHVRVRIDTMYYYKNVYDTIRIVKDTVILVENFENQRTKDLSLDQLFESSGALAKSFSGFALFDLHGDSLLYERDSWQYYTPASNMKLFTLFASLHILGDSIPGLAYQIHGDSLIFTGTADPSFLMAEFNGKDKNVFHFLKHTNKKLFYAPQNDLQHERFGNGWCWDDYNTSFSAERSEFPIYGNLVDFQLYANKHTVKVKPAYFAPLVVRNMGTPPGRSPIVRDYHTNLFEFYTQLDTWRRSKKIPFICSDRLTATLLSDTLNREVQLLKNYKLKGRCKQVYSMRKEDLIKQMMLESDNFVAEHLLLMCANELLGVMDIEKLIKSVQRIYLKDLPDKIKWVDGSGLSRYNLVTPRSMTVLLRKLYRDLPEEKIRRIFPTGGRTGTLAGMYYAKKPYVFAKTGTFTNNHCLSGFLLTKSGRWLAFSFMNNHYYTKASPVIANMERILLQVRDRY